MMAPAMIQLATSLPAAAVLAEIPSPPFRDLTVGPFSFRMYGLMIALGVLAAVWVARRRYGSYGGDPEDITTVALVAVPAGLIGARLYHVITDWERLYSGGRWWPDAFLIWRGGLGIPGGVLVGAAAGVIAARRMRIDWRLAADACAPAIPVAQAIGRLGNWFNQELYGRPTTLPWGLQIDAEPGVLFHPTFLYELLWNLALAGLIVWTSGRIVFKRGRWLAFYVLGYGLGRLWVESLREDVATHVLGLRVNIWTSLAAILGGTIWLFWRGSPVDHESTARLRAGATMADIVDGVGVRTPPGHFAPGLEEPTDPVRVDASGGDDDEHTGDGIDAGTAAEPVGVDPEVDDATAESEGPGTDPEPGGT